ncbi:MAG TPA: malto-oligosyltrehalose trehalohydrolase [Gemmataceae bacterium]|jgi:maltooligosyltrehalose trehalohydrolase
MTVPSEPGLGAVYLGHDRCRFRVWAPAARQAVVHLLSPTDRTVTLRPEPAAGYHSAEVEGVPPGSLYLYRLDAGRPSEAGYPERPDPASRHQPRGVHGPSAVVDPAFPWDDAGWANPPLTDYVLYELHVGTFTPAGTFDAAIDRLEELKDLGATAVELMPVAQFPGDRNWGYDGAYPFAVQDSYGGPAGLKRFVNAAHRRGLAVVLDVVYNHLGPEGNYLQTFGPYFTDRYRTPWGWAVNFDGPDSDGVRAYFVENARHWAREYHVDALRLDAVHAIVDTSATHILAELAAAVGAGSQTLATGRPYLIAESDLNDPRLVRPPEQGGYGLDAQWSDDFHHALHALLTGESAGYYADFGGAAALAKALGENFVYTGQHAPSRRRRHGAPAADVPPCRMVVCAQNHDQVGNRFLSDRLAATVPFDGLKLAAGAVVLSPFVPLLFMGEEYGEPAPFWYFVSHSDPALVEAVRQGRAAEFAGFTGAGERPDPQAEATFAASKTDPARGRRGDGRVLRDFYKELLRLRREVPALAALTRDGMEVRHRDDPPVVLTVRRAGGSEAAVVLHFGDTPADVPLPLPAGMWVKRLDSAADRWRGPGARSPDRVESAGEVALPLAARNVVVYERA